MTHVWKPDSEPGDDAPDALREWRWRSYTDHLEDLGYDLDGGGEPDRVGRPEAPPLAHSVFRKARGG
jgi:hypothetical protein